ncbi:MAG: hypothetical protein ACYCY7_13550 [Gallionella sp.]
MDTSIIHGTLVVIANEVKQSSKIKMHFFKPSGLPRRLRLLAMTALLDCHVGFASAALRSQLKPCCNDGAFWIPQIRGNDVPVF